MALFRGMGELFQSHESWGSGCLRREVCPLKHETASLFIVGTSDLVSSFGTFDQKTDFCEVIGGHCPHG